VPGYQNPSGKTPAVNIDTTSFPSAWPNALGLDPTWNGKWYGYFGKGVSNADFETFFVMDDSQDKKFTRFPYNYYPLNSDSGRGGLGLRVEVRGFNGLMFWLKTVSSGIMISLIFLTILTIALLSAFMLIPASAVQTLQSLQIVPIIILCWIWLIAGLPEVWDPPLTGSPAISGLLISKVPVILLTELIMIRMG